MLELIFNFNDLELFWILICNSLNFFEYFKYLFLSGGIFAPQKVWNIEAD